MSENNVKCVVLTFQIFSPLSFHIKTHHGSHGRVRNVER